MNTVMQDTQTSNVERLKAEIERLKTADESATREVVAALRWRDMESELLIYWLIQAYRTLQRSGWEEGKSDEEMRHDLVCVLANLGYDPNLSGKAAELEKRPPAYHTARALELWAKP